MGFFIFIEDGDVIVGFFIEKWIIIDNFFYFFGLFCIVKEVYFVIIDVRL